MSDTEKEATQAIQQEAAIEQFCNDTGANADTAKCTLEDCNWNIELAISTHIESKECVHSAQMAADAESSSNNMPVDSIESFDSALVAAGAESSSNPPVASSSKSVTSDSNSEVRAPIPPVPQVLGEDGYNHNFQGEKEESEEREEREEKEEKEDEDTAQLGGNSDNLIADIFGDSEGEEEFEGFEKRGRVRRIEDDDEEDEKQLLDDNEVEREESQPLYPKEEDDEKNDSEKGEASHTQATGETSTEVALPDLSSDESGDESARKRKLPEDFVYDFDIMMQKRKESFRRRKRKNVDSIINDSDDVIAELIQEMKQAAEDDFQLNKDRKAATRKLKLLPVVDSQLRKIDLREAFLDAGVLSVITDWLTPLPDRSLPNLQVRETLIKLLSELNIMDVERLKASGIGKAIMYLFKHPKETKENKRRAGALISTWARPIFNLDSDFHSMSKEEREQRDFEHMTKTKRRMSDVNEGTPSRLKTSEEKAVRPGEKGWIPRARVPMPSTRDYVVRPKSNVETEASRSGNKKAITRFDKYLRTFREKKKQTKVQRAVPISIEGRKMSL